MSADPKPDMPDLFPLPPGVRLHTRKFAAKPYSEYVTVSANGKEDAGCTQSQFAIRWEDQQQGLTVVVREQENGKLVADVVCNNAGLLGKAAVSVGLVGTIEGRMIRKTVPLNVPASGGCSGTADLGPLGDAVAELGSKLAVVVILLV